MTAATEAATAAFSSQRSSRAGSGLRAEARHRPLKGTSVTCPEGAQACSRGWSEAESPEWASLRIPSPEGAANGARDRHIGRPTEALPEIGRQLDLDDDGPDGDCRGRSSPAVSRCDSRGTGLRRPWNYSGRTLFQRSPARAPRAPPRRTRPYSSIPISVCSGAKQGSSGA